jgi:hypothetical protein
MAAATGADGLGVFAYSRWTFPGAIRVVHCENPACSRLTTNDADTAPGTIGFDYTALAIGADGRPLIASDDRNDPMVRVAHCNDAACSSANVVLFEPGGQAPSIAIGGDGLPLVAYRVGTAVRVAHCDDVACRSSTIETLGPASTFDRPAIAWGGDGRPLVVYATTTELRAAHCLDARCSSATVSTLDTSSGFSEPAVAIGRDGLPLVAYHGPWGLQLARCWDAGCTSRRTRVIASEASIGTSIVIGRDGLPLVAYLNAASTQVSLAQCTNADCRAFRHTFVAQGGDVALTIGADGLPLVGMTGPYNSPQQTAARVAHRAPRGDFDTDGRQDLVWRRDVSGDNLVWFMNGATLTSAAFTNPPGLPDTNWRIVGTNDFNLDAQTDLLWRHAVSGQNVVWFMNGVNLVGGTFTTPSALTDTRWQMVGTGDFDRDGRPDILWRHDFSGENVLWYMDGTVLTTRTFLTPSALPDVRWKMAGVADFNGDGKPDILWHHQSSGEVVLWYMDGSVLTSGTFTSPSVLPDTRWHIAAVGDYNADGRPDIVWHNDFSGQTVVWFMDNATLIAGTFTNPSVFPDTNWKLVGPR